MKTLWNRQGAWCRVSKTNIHHNNFDKCQLILEEVAQLSGYSIEQLKGKSHKRDLVEYRSIVSYICRKKGWGTLEYIGRLVGYRNHSTILHQIELVQDLLDSNDIAFNNKFKHFKHYLR